MSDQQPQQPTSKKTLLEDSVRILERDAKLPEPQQKRPPGKFLRDMQLLARTRTGG